MRCINFRKTIDGVILTLQSASNRVDRRKKLLEIHIDM